MNEFLIGFLIALAVGLTGIGGGSFTVPALVLSSDCLPGAAVGTAFVFAGVLRLIAAPFYLAGRHIHWRYLWLLMQGAVPGLLIGTLILRLLSKQSSSSDCRSAARPHADSFFDHHVRSARAESGLRAQEFALASVARVAHRHRSGLFFGGRGGAGYRAAAELFGDDVRRKWWARTFCLDWCSR